MAKTYLTEKNGEYEFRASDGSTWHIFATMNLPSPANAIIGAKYRPLWVTKRISTNPDYVMTGKIVRGAIPNFLKSVVYEIQSK